MGHAVKRAAENVRRRLLEIASDLPDAPSGKLTLQDEKVSLDEEGILYSLLIQKHFNMTVGELVGHGEMGNPDEPMLMEDRSFRETAIGAAEVDVDISTGQVHILKCVSVVDAGKAVVPELCEAQDEGASVQEIGTALYENLAYQDGN